MKVAYLTTYDSSDIHAWSGLGNYILRALEDTGLQTEPIGNLRDGQSPLLKLKELYYRKILSKQYLYDREPRVLTNYAIQAKTQLSQIAHDVIFSPGTVPIAHLETNKPIVFWTDSTFAGMVDFYPSFSHLCAETIKNGNKMEQLALSKCRIAIYSSEWAASSAIENYDVNPSKVKVVPYGANLQCDRNLQAIQQIIENKDAHCCNLLFFGVDWYRKGGDTALAVATLLNQQGFKTTLHVVGCEPPVKLPDFVQYHGFISKKTEEGQKYLEQLFYQSHFLILPSRAECFGVVFSEASSFGLPSLATKVGGIPTAIQDDKNGRTFRLDDSPEKYSSYIQHIMSSPQKYAELATSSFREYTKRLNWQVTGREVSRLLEEFCG